MLKMVLFDCQRLLAGLWGCTKSQASIILCSVERHTWRHDLNGKFKHVRRFHIAVRPTTRRVPVTASPIKYTKNTNGYTVVEPPSTKLESLAARPRKIEADRFLSRLRKSRAIILHIFPTFWPFFHSFSYGFRRRNACVE